MVYSGAHGNKICSRAQRRVALALHARESGTGAAVILLHGLYGAGGNLGALARALREDFTVCALDLPGHGRSGWLARYDLAAMAACVRDWMDQRAIARAHLVGHSLGGKVAMELALAAPQRVATLVVADIAPLAYPARHDAVFDALAAVDTAQCRSRDAAAQVLREVLSEEQVIQFLLTGLYRDEGGVYRWRLDRLGLQRDYAALLAAPDAHQPWPGPALFIAGGASDYVDAAGRAAIDAWFPAATLQVMPGCGHWLHVQDAPAFNARVRRFLAASER